MTENLGVVIDRLKTFIETVPRQAGNSSMQRHVGEMSTRPPRQNPIERMIEECLGQLTSAECKNLDELVEKMSRILGNQNGVKPSP
jgi:hypothetical protein